MFDFEGLIDFTGPLGLLCMLCICLGELRRRLKDAARMQLAAGVLFGLVAILEMQLPIEPFPGVIVDLRNVPIALAGAFLGWRGMFICLALAAVTRMQIGGAGMMAGIVSMTVAGYCGLAWAHLTQGSRRRSVLQLLALGAAMPLTFTGILFLPRDIAPSFLVSVAPVLSAFYIVILPTVGALLQREILRIEAEEAMRRGMTTCPENGLLRPASFLRSAMQLAREEPGNVAGILVITPNVPRWLARFWGHRAVGRIEGELAAEIGARFRHGDHAGISQDGRLLVLLTLAEREDDSLLDTVALDLAQAQLQAAPGVVLRVRPVLRVVTTEDDAALKGLLLALDGVDHETTVPKRATRAQGKGKPGARDGAHALFDRFDTALAQSNVQGRLPY